MMSPFTIPYYCIKLLRELQQVTEFSPAETLLPPAYHVNLPLIRSFIPFSGTDGMLRAVKHSGSPGTPEEESSTPFPRAVMPIEGSCGAVPGQGVCSLLPGECCRLSLQCSHLPQEPWGSAQVTCPSFLQGFLI